MNERGVCPISPIRAWPVLQARINPPTQHPAGPLSPLLPVTYHFGQNRIKSTGTVYEDHAIKREPKKIKGG